MKQKIINFLDAFGLTWFIPLVRLVTGEEPGKQVKDIFTMIGLPIIGLGIFMLAWTVMAKNITTSVGFLPGPSKVMESAGKMIEHHKLERAKEKQHVAKELKRKAKFEKSFPDKTYKVGQYTGQDPATLRLPLQSLVFLVGRYAVGDDMEHRTVTGMLDIERAREAVEDHLVALARSFFPLPRG